MKRNLHVNEMYTFYIDSIAGHKTELIFNVTKLLEMFNLASLCANQAYMYKNSATVK